AVVDDGTGAVTAFVNRQLTEELLGRDLEACQAAAREAMSREVITDDLEEKLLLRRATLRGSASHDDYGTTLMVDSLELNQIEDPTERAETLLDRVHVLSQEVSV
ncbi:MAG: replication factor A, partial [Candidatus Thermoplasmatota archaeon]|nr:replication factor A [Candidatus Thermoplasmatota archaeon]